MATAPGLQPATHHRLDWSVIILAALIAASIDALWFSTTAWLQGSSGYVVMQLTGGFWMTHGALKAGAASFLLGCATHVTVATMMATGFALLYPRLAVLRRAPLVGGTLYGLFLYVVMNLIVLPLRWPSNFPRFAGWQSLGDLLIHVAFGIVFAVLIGRRASA